MRKQKDRWKQNSQGKADDDDDGEQEGKKKKSRNDKDQHREEKDCVSIDLATSIADFTKTSGQPT